MRKLIVLVALAATAACTSDLPSEPLVGSLEGTYSLSTMNGSPLPFTIVSHDTTFNIDTDVITLTAAGGWSETVSYRQTAGTNTTTNENFALDGTWGRNGNSLNFQITGGGTIYLGTATDSSLNLTDGGFNYVFLR